MLLFAHEREHALDQFLNGSMSLPLEGFTLDWKPFFEPCTLARKSIRPAKNSNRSREFCRSAPHPQSPSSRLAATS